MNRLGITTPERGLVLEITIWNNSTESYPRYYYPYRSDNDLQITIRITSNESPSSNLFDQISIGNLYLPSYGSDIRFLKITDNSGNNLSAGSYSATLTYGDGMKIEPYPFDFKVMSEQEFQQKIEQNKSGTTYNFYFQIALFGGSSSIVLVSVGIGIYLWRRRERDKSGEKGKPKRKGPRSKK
jgi:hypothetical protein